MASVQLEDSPHISTSELQHMSSWIPRCPFGGRFIRLKPFNVPDYLWGPSQPEALITDSRKLRIRALQADQVEVNLQGARRARNQVTVKRFKESALGGLLLHILEFEQGLPLEIVSAVPDAHNVDDETLASIYCPTVVSLLQSGIEYESIDVGHQQTWDLFIPKDAPEPARGFALQALCTTFQLMT